VIVTEELKNLANGEQIEFVIEISEEEYRDACLELIIAHREGMVNPRAIGYFNIK
jgi:hypothetical protein